MKRFSFPLLLLAILQLGLFSSPHFAQVNGKLRTSKRPIPNHYIVVLEDNADNAFEMISPLLGEQRIQRAVDDLSILYGGKVDMVYTSAIQGYSVEMSREQADELSRDARVKYVEEDFVISAEDTQFNAPWPLDRIDQREGVGDTHYNYLTSGSGVHAYVIDSGIRASHFEFTGRVLFGADFVGDGQNGNDCAGHGTHVAGILGSATYGVAKNVTIHNIRVLGCDGTGFGSGLLAAIDWVTNNHAASAVANISIGLDAPSTAIENAITNSIAHGVNYALAAGNESTDACNHSPGGRVPNAITVGATYIDDWRADFSNYGTCVDIFAPGANITSTWYTSDTATAVLGGTSMAAPHVAGAIARLLQANPASSPSDIKNALINSATIGVVIDAKNSPNRLLYIDPGFTPPPRPQIVLDDNGGSPNPGEYTISNVPGVIDYTPGSVRVKLKGLSHSFPNDLALVLIGPTGNAISLQVRAGGSVGISNVTYTISDVGTLLPANGTANGATYKPTLYGQPLGYIPGSGNIKPNNPGPGGTDTLSGTFGGLSPNGTWRLFVMDLGNHLRDAGALGDWSLEVDTVPAPTDQNPAAPPGGAVGFVGSDSVTKGNWIDTFGSLAGYMPQRQSFVNDWISPTIPNLQLYSWNVMSTDQRGFSNGPYRSLPTLFSPGQIEIPFRMKDNRTYRFAFYFVDFDGRNRNLTVDVINTDTGTLIDSRSITNFNGGRYLIWQLRGNFTIKIKNNGGASPDAVLSGFFVDPLPDSSIPPPDLNSVARFEGFDVTTKGNWVGKYGGQGAIIPLDTDQTLPAWAGYRPFGTDAFSTIDWGNPFGDVRALQKASDHSQRIVSAISATTEFGLTFNFTDGNVHRLALYNLDLDGEYRDQFFEIVDEFGTVIDRRRLHITTGGIYAVWEVKGKFTVWVKNLDLTRVKPVVISGIFVDAPGPIPDQVPTSRTNAALAINAATATASSQKYSYYDKISGAIDGDRTAYQGCDRSCWVDNTPDIFPDWLQIDFNGSRTINEIDVITHRENSYLEPTEDTIFTQSGITAYDVQVWNGLNWITVPNGTVTNNNKVWKKFLFAPIETTKIRVVVNSSLTTYSLIDELEAWTVSGSPTPTPTPTPTSTPTPTPTSTPTATPTPTPDPTPTPTPPLRTAVADFDGDGKTDPTVFRGSDHNWYALESGGGVLAQAWGNANDVLTPGDYDGDGRADTAIYRVAEGLWYIVNSATSTVSIVHWGNPTDKPVLGDFDGDGRSDIAVYRPSEGNWYIINSQSGSISSYHWGIATDKPVPADYDGDGKTDVAVYRESDNTWYIINSQSGSVSSYYWGTAGDKPVEADYDGDGRDDVAVYRPSEGNWYIINSQTGSVSSYHWGIATDIPVPGDYDGDGRSDVAVYRESDNNWYIINSQSGSVSSFHWGTAGDIPIPARLLP